MIHCSIRAPFLANDATLATGTSLPVNAVGEKFSWYLLAGFIMPFVYGSWRFTVYHLLMGPLLAYTTTNNMNEWPAVWCLFSFGFAFIAFETPLRRWMYVKNCWYCRGENR